jgi:hypothetical protein
VRIETIHIRSYCWKVCSNSCHLVVFLVFDSSLPVLIYFFSHLVRFILSCISVVTFIFLFYVQDSFKNLLHWWFSGHELVWVFFFNGRTLLLFQLWKIVFLGTLSRLEVIFFQGLKYIIYSMLSLILKFLLRNRLFCWNCLFRCLGASLF